MFRTLNLWANNRPEKLLFFLPHSLRTTVQLGMADAAISEAGQKLEKIPDNLTPDQDWEIRNKIFEELQRKVVDAKES